MGINCAPLVADLFLFCYERDFMKSLTKKNGMFGLMFLIQLLNIDNIHFEQVGHRIYPVELQHNTANVSDTENTF